MNPLSRVLRLVIFSTDGIRGGWRALIFAAIAWYMPNLFYWLAGEFAGYSPTLGFSAFDIAFYAATTFLASVIAGWGLTRLERRDMGWFGFPLNRSSLTGFASGALWGGGVVTILVVVLFVLGFFSFRGIALPGSYFLGYFVFWAVSMILVGFAEELFYRGYALKALAGSIGFWPGAILTSLVFGGVHLFFKPMETVADILNIVLLGLFLCYSIWKSGTLWFAIGFHAAFDFFALSLYGAPNTGNNGLPLENHLLDTRIEGPVWLTGGPQGLEASWLIVPLTLLMTLLFRLIYSKHYSSGQRTY